MQRITALGRWKFLGGLSQTLQPPCHDSFLLAYRLSGKLLEPREARQKCGAYLARRGFGWDVIKAACQRAGADEDDDDWNEDDYDVEVVYLKE